MIIHTYLLLISHGTPAQNGHFCHGVLLKPLHRIAFGTKELSNKVELEEVDNKHYGAIKDATLIMAKSCIKIGVIDANALNLSKTFFSFASCDNLSSKDLI